MSSETTNTSALIPHANGLSAFFVRLRTTMHGLYNSLQTAQMAAALNRMTDTQLAEIGIKRREIFAHAEDIVAGRITTK